MSEKSFKGTLESPMMMVDEKQYKELLDAVIAKSEKTLRDEIAIAAMQGHISNSEYMNKVSSRVDDLEELYKEVSSTSYRVADAMLAERRNK